VELPPIFDPAQLEAIAALQEPGEDGLLAELLTEFATDARQLLQRMAAAIEAHDPEEAKVAAHTLKSSAGYLGGERLSYYSAELEALCRQGWDATAFDRAQRLYQQAEEAYAALTQALAQATETLTTA
jgi:HPt (histidine-containing phosphotransfer) domain-containing protein